ncbi:MAG TPA: hypothetical protein VMR75_04390 [Candidatus Saccharimonadales bacterium]|nr:hypothetical protein [Candidatus Saccharimonadales bacterium]
MSTDTVDAVHPLVAAPRQLLLAEPPSVAEVINRALEHWKDHPRKPLELTLADCDHCDIEPFRSVQARIWGNAKSYDEVAAYAGDVDGIEVNHYFDDFVIPTTILTEAAPSSGALLCFEEGRLHSLVFHRYSGNSILGRNMMRVMDQATYFDSIIADIKSITPHRTEAWTLRHIMENRWQRSEEEVQLALKLVKDYYNRNEQPSPLGSFL